MGKTGFRDGIVAGRIREVHAQTVRSSLRKTQKLKSCNRPQGFADEDSGSSKLFVTAMHSLPNLSLAALAGLLLASCQSTPAPNPTPRGAVHDGSPMVTSSLDPASGSPATRRNKRRNPQDTALGKALQPVAVGLQAAGIAVVTPAIVLINCIAGDTY
jgi:hypothetical protein